MCGIAVIFSKKWNKPERENTVSGMLDVMRHRGPDYSGIYSDGEVTLGHNRLSIIDLSESARQPMFSFNRKLAIVFNGEIYNYKSLRLELERVPARQQSPAYPFQTNSDTEVVLAAYLRWGPKCLHYFKGMFAFVIYDFEKKTIFAARDRFGVKPLYYYFSDDHVVFSSEIRPMLRYLPVRFSLNRDTLNIYLNYQTFFHDQTPVRQIKMLLPGHYIEFSENKKEMVQYYHPADHIQKINTDEKDCLNNIRQKVYLSVERRMVSDVPVAAFLSGGVDSSIVVACMAQLSSTPIHTFHVTFHEKEYSEFESANAVAKKYNTKHVPILLKPESVLQQIHQFASSADIPTGDGLNTWVISKAVHEQGIRVALSGIGGDEWFMGYPVFNQIQNFFNKKYFLKLLPYIPSFVTDIVFPPKRNIRNAKFHDIVKNNIRDLLGWYAQSRKLFTDTHHPYVKQKIANLPHRSSEKKDIPLLTQVSLLEWEYYLMPVLLRDADVFSMAHGLEIREPFLDHELVEYALGIPEYIKNQNLSKKLLIRAFQHDMPDSVWNRKKMGFTLPMQLWMQNELRSWCEKEIHSLHDKNIFVGVDLINLWYRFLNQDPLVSWTRVWHLVMFNQWLEKNNLNL
ncbi:MAG: asparagine synthase (glutamine-hydrolyzing) [Bacteroidia bacterium]|nr:asparagine synthase (glutamine-hydrolyzing) [Bacteroidia bacterium]